MKLRRIGRARLNFMPHFVRKQKSALISCRLNFMSPCFHVALISCLKVNDYLHYFFNDKIWNQNSRFFFNYTSCISDPVKKNTQRLFRKNISGSGEHWRRIWRLSDVNGGEQFNLARMRRGSFYPAGSPGGRLSGSQIIIAMEKGVERSCFTAILKRFAGRKYKIWEFFDWPQNATSPNWCRISTCWKYVENCTNIKLWTQYKWNYTKGTLF